MPCSKLVLVCSFLILPFFSSAGAGKIEKRSYFFKEAEKLIQNIENNILIGRIKAQKFLHPTGYISKFSKLRDWLEKYDDHPSASRIYWLSKRKKPKNLKSAKKPSGGYLSGFGNADFVSLRPRIPSSYSGRSAPSATRKVAFTIRKYIRRSWPTGALEFLNKKSSRKVLTDGEESQLHWEVANAYFIFNKDFEAIRAEEQKVLNGITEKYGPGTLDPNTGVFTPSDT